VAWDSEERTDGDVDRVARLIDVDYDGRPQVASTSGYRREIYCVIISACVSAVPICSLIDLFSLNLFPLSRRRRLTATSSTLNPRQYSRVLNSRSLAFVSLRQRRRKSQTLSILHWDLTVGVFMIALCNRADHYIFAL